MLIARLPLLVLFCLLGLEVVPVQAQNRFERLRTVNIDLRKGRWKLTRKQCLSKCGLGKVGPFLQSLLVEVQGLFIAATVFIQATH